MREGIPFICENKFLGYRKDPNDERNLIIVPEEAEVVKLIYKLYTSGVGTCEIARILMKKGYKTGAKKDKWYSSTVEGIIKNENIVVIFFFKKLLPLIFYLINELKTMVSLKSTTSKTTINLLLIETHGIGPKKYLRPIKQSLKTIPNYGDIQLDIH